MSAQGAEIVAGCAVSVRYRLELKGGITLDVSKDPVSFVHGAAGFPQPLQKALTGRRPGDKVSLPLTPQEAYGERNEALVIKVPRAQFKAAEPLSVGERLEGSQPGFKAGCLVVALDSQSVTVDFNPPVSGMEVMVHLEVVDVRPAKSTLEPRRS